MIWADLPCVSGYREGPQLLTYSIQGEQEKGVVLGGVGVTFVFAPSGPISGGPDRRCHYQRLRQHDRFAEGSDPEGIWVVHRV